MQRIRPFRRWVQHPVQHSLLILLLTDLQKMRRPWTLLPYTTHQLTHLQRQQSPELSTQHPYTTTHPSTHLQRLRPIERWTLHPLQHSSTATLT